MLDYIYEYDPVKERIKSVDKAIMIVAMFMLCLIPLIMYRHDMVSYSTIFNGNNYATGEKVDVFNFFKSVAIILSTCVLIGLFIYKLVVFNCEIRKTKLNYIVLFFATVIMITPLVSKYTDIALLGNYDRHEGALAWFSYLSLFFVIYNTDIKREHYKYFYLAIVPFIIINLITGITNLSGHNLLDNEFINNILGGGLSGYLITTLYHPNFGSAMSAVVFCVSFTYLLLEEDTKVKIGLLITTVMSFAMLLSMISSGGFVTVLIVIPIILALTIRLTSVKNVAIWAGITMVLNAISYMIISKLDERVYGESLAIIEKINSISPIIIPVAIVGFVGVVLVLNFINTKIAFDIVTAITVVVVSVGCVALSNTIEKDIDKIKNNTIYQKVNEMSTDRINIWMKTIDLIRDKPLFGHGFDTYPYSIIETDADRGVSTYGEFIDKPHNWYLTVAYGSGVLGIVGLMGVLIYILRGVFNSWSDKIDNKYMFIFGVGVIAYAVQGLSNDSLSGSSIVFWVMAGLCVNMLLTAKEQ